MKNIDITTSQNVTVQYALATVAERAIALGIDLFIMGVSGMILFGLSNIIFTWYTDVTIYFTLIPIVILYSLMFEYFNHGQTPGKRFLNIRVIRLDGEKAGFFDYMMRWVFRSLDIYLSFGGAAILSIIASTYNQRLGDILANTVVVNVGKNERIPIERLLKLNESVQIKITYPQIINMSEESMLIVKETLGKQMSIHNDAHSEALTLLAEKMKKELNIKTSKDPVVFLKTLLKDYIVLTR